MESFSLNSPETTEQMVNQTTGGPKHYNLRRYWRKAILRRGTPFWSQKYRTIFKALKIQEEIVILQEIQELQDSVPRQFPYLNALSLFGFCTLDSI